LILWLLMAQGYWIMLVTTHVLSDVTISMQHSIKFNWRFPIKRGWSKPSLIFLKERKCGRFFLSGIFRIFFGYKDQMIPKKNNLQILNDTISGFIIHRLNKISKTKMVSTKYLQPWRSCRQCNTRQKWNSMLYSLLL
jgi:hypothetical protein